MIKNISFNGKVHLVGRTAIFNRDSELKLLKKYAKDNDCDLVVLNNFHHEDGSGRYQVLKSKVNIREQENEHVLSVFDFGKDNDMLQRLGSFMEDDEFESTVKSLPVEFHEYEQGKVEFRRDY